MNVLLSRSETSNYYSDDDHLPGKITDPTPLIAYLLATILVAIILTMTTALVTALATVLVTALMTRDHPRFLLSWTFES